MQRTLEANECASETRHKRTQLLRPTFLPLFLFSVSFSVFTCASQSALLIRQFLLMNCSSRSPSAKPETFSSLLLLLPSVNRSLSLSSLTTLPLTTHPCHRVLPSPLHSPSQWLGQQMICDRTPEIDRQQGMGRRRRKERRRSGRRFNCFRSLLLFAQMLSCSLLFW